MTDGEIADRIQALLPRLKRLRECLISFGYVFQEPDAVLPGPDSRSDETLARIERTAGPIPKALSEFYKVIGGVDFSGHHPEWTGCDYPDPLIVHPPWYVEDELEEFLHDPADYIHYYGSFRIPIAPDYYHKADVSGGMWYGVPIPSESADPPLLEEPHDTTFLNYLEIALYWGGFPGLEGESDNHTWPITALREAAAERGPSRSL